MTHTFLRWLHRLLEGRFELVVRGVLILSLAGVLLFALGKSSLGNSWPLLKSSDSLFALLMGLMTIMGLILAIVSIRGLFDRLTTFDQVLRAAAGIMDEAERYILILGYYPAFGCVTALERGAFHAYRQAMERRSNTVHFLVAVHDPEEQERIIRRYAEVWSKDAALQDAALKANRDVMTTLQNTAGAIREHRGAVVFVDRRVMPDVHVVANEERAVIFVPCRTPHLAEPGAHRRPAEVLGFVTSYREHVELMFQLYTGISIEKFDGSLYPTAPSALRVSVGEAITYRVPCIGGVAPYAITCRAPLPEGLCLDEGGGVISGRLSAAGTHCVGLTIGDARGASVECDIAFEATE